MIALPPVSIEGRRIGLPIDSQVVLELLLGYSMPARDGLGALLLWDPSLLLWAVARGPRRPRWSQLLSVLRDSLPEMVRPAWQQAEQLDDGGESFVRKRVRKYRRWIAADGPGDDAPARAARQLVKLLGCVAGCEPAVADRWLTERLDVTVLWEERDEVTRRALQRLRSGQIASPAPLFAAVFRLRDLELDFEAAVHQRKMAAMKALAYGASHEINNPLANIASRAQTLLIDETDPRRRQLLEAVNRQAFRAHEMIADMMLFAHPPAASLAAVNPGDILRRVAEQWEPLAREQGTRLEVETAAGPPVQADAGQLSEALGALVRNGLEAVREEGQVHMTARDSSSRRQVDFEVSDNGPGLDREAEEHLFDPFFSGREAGRGLGFGLSKAWTIAQMHGGEITGTNLPHGGALFRLSIPYAPASSCPLG